MISNALKYRSPELPPRVLIHAKHDGDFWGFAIEDNGIGIEDRDRDRIFGIFKRLHGNKYPGTGIGLALCRKIVERHGGRIWVESKVGQGSTSGHACRRNRAVGHDDTALRSLNRGDIIHRINHTNGLSERENISCLYSREPALSASALFGSSSAAAAALFLPRHFLASDRFLWGLARLRLNRFHHGLRYRTHLRLSPQSCSFRSSRRRENRTRLRVAGSSPRRSPAAFWGAPFYT